MYWPCTARGPLTPDGGHTGGAGAPCVGAFRRMESDSSDVAVPAISSIALFRALSLSLPSPSSNVL